MNHLHILNGFSTQAQFVKSGISGDVVVWNTMLVEGPLESNTRGNDFWQLRQQYMNEAYNVSPETYQAKTIDEIDKLKDVSNYYEITLWFEYDLFCHVNMLACLSHLRHEKISIVCVGNEDGDLMGLGEFHLSRFPDFFLDRILLDIDDLKYATSVWQAYACDDPQKLFPFINQPNSKFYYLSEALKTHLKRFPDSRTGLNEIETEMLTQLSRGIKNKKELIKHMLNWQVWYGFGDSQFERVLDELRPFINEIDFSLNEQGFSIIKKSL
jgi:hypothetical protein